MTALLRSLLLLTLCLALPAQSAEAPKPAKPVQLRMQTTQGNITLELYPDRAPKTVANFVAYADAHFYEGLIFHRVIPGFMIQGGGYDRDYKERATRAPVANEADNGLQNLRGTIAMARTGDPHSATGQFFINHADNARLDYPSFDGWGYTVFGRVTEGIEIVDRIAAIPTGAGGPFDTDVPVEAVVIKKVTVLSR